MFIIALPCEIRQRPRVHVRRPVCKAGVPESWGLFLELELRRLPASWRLVWLGASTCGKLARLGRRFGQSGWSAATLLTRLTRVKFRLTEGRLRAVAEVSINANG